jgi:hypothetical protein
VHFESDIRIREDTPFAISTSLGIKDISSCTSRQGCRASLRTRSPVPVLDKDLCNAQFANAQLRTLLQDGGFDVRFRSVNSNMGKATRTP